ncbi:GNAT family N-acetyltransferase [bacterium]|nr:GNAT family N-acetyltransferase [bacterium]
MEIKLRKMIDSDLEIYFQNQLDPDANQMAAFTSKDPNDREAFDAHWNKIRNLESVIIRTILCDDEIAGSVLKFDMEDEPEVSYWIGKSFWGKGIATAGLKLFLEELTIRPLFARVAFDNIGSRRVLEKCGFIYHDKSRYFSNARGLEIEEHIYTLSE